jgi:hypothetical protein
MGRTLAIVACALALSGCPSGGGAIPGRDAGPPRDAGRDAGPDAFGEDAGPDAAAGEDAGAEKDAGGDDVDAGGLDAGRDAGAGGDDAGLDAGRDAGAGAGDGGRDAGRRVPPTIDGVLAPGEWEGAAWVVNTVPTAWRGNELRSLRALLLPEGLYLAVEGTVSAPNAIVVYLDRARGSAEGVALAALTDSIGALDDAMTAGFATPADVRPDLGWGTLDLGRSAVGADARMGWRDFVRAVSPDDLYWILSGDAPTACGASLCETYLPRSILDMGAGASRPRTIAIFARITNGDGLMSSNQTLPEDAPEMPYTVTRLLTLDE